MAVNLTAQKYDPFPTENAQWNVFYASKWEDSPNDTILFQYSLQGDTTINNTTYRKVCRNIGTIAQSIYKGIGGLREQDKKIYYYGLSYAERFGILFNHEVLLYDFTKNIGDTVWLNKEWETNKILWKKSYIITKIDSINIGNEYRKRYNGCIIEGIGDVMDGLLGRITPHPTCIGCSQEWHFICFRQKGERVYKNPDYMDCNSIKKTDSAYNGLINPIKYTSVTVSPNPLMSTSVIKWNTTNNNLLTTLVISDVLGKTIKTLNVSGLTEISINRKDFVKGLYVGTLILGSSSKTMVKIIVQ